MSLYAIISLDTRNMREYAAAYIPLQLPTKIYLHYNKLTSNSLRCVQNIRQVKR